MADHVDESNDEGAEGDTAEGIGHAALQGAPGRTTGHTAGFAGAEEPRTVYAGDGGMDSVLDPFGDPLERRGISNPVEKYRRGQEETYVAGKGYEDNEADNFGGGAAAAC